MNGVERFASQARSRNIGQCLCLAAPASRPWDRLVNSSACHWAQNRNKDRHDRVARIRPIAFDQFTIADLGYTTRWPFSLIASQKVRESFRGGIQREHPRS